MRKQEPLVKLTSVFRTKTVESAKAEGEKIRLIGAADARAVEAVGRWVVGKYCCNEPSRSFTY